MGGAPGISYDTEAALARKQTRDEIEEANRRARELAADKAREQQKKEEKEEKRLKAEWDTMNERWKEVERQRAAENEAKGIIPPPKEYPKWKDGQVVKLKMSTQTRELFNAEIAAKRKTAQDAGTILPDWLNEDWDGAIGTVQKHRVVNRDNPEYKYTMWVYRLSGTSKYNPLLLKNLSGGLTAAAWLTEDIYERDISDYTKGFDYATQEKMANEAKNAYWMSGWPPKGEEHIKAKQKRDAEQKKRDEDEQKKRDEEKQKRDEEQKQGGKRRSKPSNKPKKSAKRVKTAKRAKSRRTRRQHK
jgi:hypothetical protein